MIKVEPELELFRDDEVPEMDGVKRSPENSQPFTPIQEDTSLVCWACAPLSLQAAARRIVTLDAACGLHAGADVALHQTVLLKSHGVSSRQHPGRCVRHPTEGYASTTRFPAGLLIVEGSPRGTVGTTGIA
jgi:hypothetical protein